jgi:hypothetical protein
MKLPFVDRAEISEAKIVNYLLSATHRAGKAKRLLYAVWV